MKSITKSKASEIGEELVDAKNSAGVAHEDYDCEDDIGLVDARAPGSRAFGAHIIKKQEKRDAGCKPRSETEHERDSDVNLGDDNQRRKSRDMRYHHRIKQTLIPGIAIFQRKFEEPGRFIRNRIAVIAKKEADPKINAREDKKPLPRTTERGFFDRINRIHKIGSRSEAGLALIGQNLW